MFRQSRQLCLSILDPLIFLTGFETDKARATAEGRGYQEPCCPLRLIIPKHSSFADSFGTPQQLAPFLHPDLQQQNLEINYISFENDRAPLTRDAEVFPTIPAYTA
jgi:hypothetical protein